MKNIISLVTIFSLIFIFIASCEKEGVTITKVINVQLKKNESYSYNVPKAKDEDDAMMITKQAEHFLRSDISQSGSDVIFNYTPSLDFVGNDEVNINPVEDSNHGHHGGCSGNDDDDVTIYNFKITVVGGSK